MGGQAQQSMLRLGSSQVGKSRSLSEGSTVVKRWAVPPTEQAQASQPSVLVAGFGDYYLLGVSSQALSQKESRV